MSQKLLPTELELTHYRQRIPLRKKMGEKWGKNLGHGTERQ